MMLGNRIRSLREDKDLSQKDLGIKLGVSASTIGMYEQDRRSPDAEMLLKIANFFNVSTDYLLGKTDIRNPQKSNDKASLSIKEQIKLDKEAEEIINDLKVSLSQNKGSLTENDYEILNTSIRIALETMTKKNKEKYTPNKYK